MAEGKSGTETHERDIFAVLQDEHEQAAVLLEQVMDTDDSDVETRRELYREVRRSLMAHAKAEEAEFYPLCRHHAETRVLAHQASEDHEDIEQLLSELDEMPLDAPSWIETFDTLKSNIELHVDLEENEIFPKLREILEAQDLRTLREAYIARRELIEQHPEELEPTPLEAPEVRPEV